MLLTVVFTAGMTRGALLEGALHDQDSQRRVRRGI